MFLVALHHSPMVMILSLLSPERVTRGIMEHRVPKVHRVLKGIRVFRVLLELKVHKVLKVSKVVRVLMVLKVL